jgi:DNA-binding transcriptional LysR family regulator
MHPSATALLNRLLVRGKFRHIQVLLKLAELGSIQRTAESIGTTQSAVTQTLAYLEEMLETPLFQRHARGVRPTRACTELLPVARQLLEGLFESVEVISAHHRGGGMLRLIGSESATQSLLVPALPEFFQRHPAVQVHLRQAEGDDQLLAISHGEVDLLACRCPAAVPAGWEFVPLLEDEYGVVCAPDHPLRRRSRVAWGALANQVWLLAPSGTAVRMRFDELAARFEQPPRTHALVTRALAATAAVLRTGKGIALLPRSIVQHMVDAGDLAFVPIDETIAMQPIGLMRPVGELGEAAAKFCEFLLERATQTPAPTSHPAMRGRRRAAA